MHQTEYFKNRIFKIGNHREFTEVALELFQFQSFHNDVYRSYLDALGINPQVIDSLDQIPFLPISFFKTTEVRSTSMKPERVFTSSGTTGTTPSRHFLTDENLYIESFLRGFRLFYGDPGEFTILALLPSYLERDGSSLVFMVDHLINASNDPESGFYLSDLDKLHRILLRKIDERKKVLLLGVSFGLMDFAEQFKLPENRFVIMETGGMKGRRKEILRAEVHQALKKAFHAEVIHSEYGMTELLSQAYSKGDGIFEYPPWVQVIIRDVDDPFSRTRVGKTGGINIVDLANIESCAFIETQDLGRMRNTHQFEVMGRFDNADIRGCNLMVL